MGIEVCASTIVASLIFYKPSKRSFESELSLQMDQVSQEANNFAC